MEVAGGDENHDPRATDAGSAAECDDLSVVSGKLRHRRLYERGDRRPIYFHVLGLDFVTLGVGLVEMWTVKSAGGLTDIAVPPVPTYFVRGDGTLELYSYNELSAMIPKTEQHHALEFVKRVIISRVTGQCLSPLVHLAAPACALLNMHPALWLDAATAQGGLNVSPTTVFAATVVSAIIGTSEAARFTSDGIKASLGGTGAAPLSTLVVHDPSSEVCVHRVCVHRVLLAQSILMFHGLCHRHVRPYYSHRREEWLRCEMHFMRTPARTAHVSVTFECN